MGTPQTRPRSRASSPPVSLPSRARHLIHHRIPLTTLDLPYPGPRVSLALFSLSALLAPSLPPCPALFSHSRAGPLQAHPPPPPRRTLLLLPLLYLTNHRLSLLQYYSNTLDHTSSTSFLDAPLPQPALLDISWTAVLSHPYPSSPPVELLKLRRLHELSTSPQPLLHNFFYTTTTAGTYPYRIRGEESPPRTCCSRQFHRTTRLPQLAAAMRAFRDAIVFDGVGPPTRAGVCRCHGVVNGVCKTCALATKTNFR